MTGKVCAKCQVELRPKENDVATLEMAGTQATAVWSADLWACPGCGIEVLLGFGRAPIAERANGNLGAAFAQYTTLRAFWHSLSARDAAQSTKEMA